MQVFVFGTTDGPEKKEAEIPASWGSQYGRNKKHFNCEDQTTVRDPQRASWTCISTATGLGWSRPPLENADVVKRLQDFSEKTDSPAHPGYTDPPSIPGPSENCGHHQLSPFTPACDPSLTSCREWNMGPKFWDITKRQTMKSRECWLENFKLAWQDPS